MTGSLIVRAVFVEEASLVSARVDEQVGLVGYGRDPHRDDASLAAVSHDGVEGVSRNHA